MMRRWEKLFFYLNLKELVKEPLFQVLAVLWAACAFFLLYHVLIGAPKYKKEMNSCMQTCMTEEKSPYGDLPDPTVEQCIQVCQLYL